MTTKKGAAPYAVQVRLEHGGVAVLGSSARNERKLGFRLDRLEAIFAGLPAGEWYVRPVPGKRKRRAAARKLPQLPEREHDPRYSRRPGAAAPEWTIAHELALAAKAEVA